MTMNGVDVSSWQGNFHPENLPVDFCIVKATEGLGYVNGYCDMVVQRCIKAGLPWGFYHFAVITTLQKKPTTSSRTVGVTWVSGYLCWTGKLTSPWSGLTSS